MYLVGVSRDTVDYQRTIARDVRDGSLEQAVTHGWREAATGIEEPSGLPSLLVVAGSRNS